MSVTLEAVKPARLDIVDMPRDTERCLGGLRQALCATFNYVKNYPKKLEVFVAVLEYTLARAKEYTTGAVEEAQKVKLEAAQKAADEAKLALEQVAKEKLAAEVKAIKEAGKVIISTAQEITVLEDLKEYIVTQGFEIEGEKLEDIRTSFVKAKTAAVLAQVAECKATQE